LSTLTKLKAATGLDDLAAILGYKPSSLAYLLYVLPSASKYTTFSIPKKSGGTRTIQAPEARLKTLQKHLANALYACVGEIHNTDKRPSLSHGFKKNHSIVTNARSHTARRFVLNFDLADFFPSFNFGRVRGFFIANNNFKLNDKIATLIAQIAIHNNEMPQGSPCSPVIADLITHLLDVRLAQLAKTERCMYSRYADDITFSTNQKNFPLSIATNPLPPVWDLSEQLTKIVTKAGFAINSKKTRMQTSPGRQVVTGLCVNRKVNVQATYYRYARSMCHSLFKSGTYQRPNTWETLTPTTPLQLASPLPLEGVINFIYTIKSLTDRRDSTEKKGDPTGSTRLYRNLLNFRHFITLEKPLIVCEGKTDNVYLNCAIRQLPAYRTRFSNEVAGKSVSNLKFFKYTDVTQDVMLLGGGTGDMIKLIQNYHSMAKKYLHRPMAHPVILLIDNDSGANGIFGIIKNLFNITATHSTTSNYYYLGYNLYMVKTPEVGDKKFSCIEDFFPSAVTATTIAGKHFDPDKKHGDDSKYGKHVFAENIVRPNMGSIDFSGFVPLLERVARVIDHYATLPKPP
jgi:RNA-directed DNA polymerase